uniref:Uncharacterized protein n=1 Tax=Arion vulgaris TaxID=1028688 RepID=A0A0B7BW91_9EUPU
MIIFKYFESCDSLVVRAFALIMSSQNRHTVGEVFVFPDHDGFHAHPASVLLCTRETLECTGEQCLGYEQYGTKPCSYRQLYIYILVCVCVQSSIF